MLLGKNNLKVKSEMIVNKITRKTKSNYFMLLLMVAVLIQLGLLVYRLNKLMDF